MSKNRFVYDEDDIEGLEFEDDEDLDDAELGKAGWDESKHPRHPKGRSEGGRFRGTHGEAWRGSGTPDDPYERVPVYVPTKEEVDEANSPSRQLKDFVEDHGLVVYGGGDDFEGYAFDDGEVHIFDDGHWEVTADFDEVQGLAPVVARGKSMAALARRLGWDEPTKKFFKADGVSEELGLVFGWAIVCKEGGEPYFDSQDDHIPEDSMTKAAVDFMENSRVMKEMHAGDEQGFVVFAWPMTEDIAKSMGIETKKTGLMIAVKPKNPDVLNKFRSGEYTGFSIGGTRLHDEDFDKAGTYDESKHRRHPKGKEEGGQFAPKDGGGGTDSKDDDGKGSEGGKTYDYYGDTQADLETPLAVGDIIALGDERFSFEPIGGTDDTGPTPEDITVGDVMDALDDWENAKAQPGVDSDFRPMTQSDMTAFPGVKAGSKIAYKEFYVFTQDSDGVITVHDENAYNLKPEASEVKKGFFDPKGKDPAALIQSLIEEAGGLDEIADTYLANPESLNELLVEFRDNLREQGLEPKEATREATRAVNQIRAKLRTLQRHTPLEAPAGAGGKPARKAEWDESKHPRHPKGSEEGGQFASEEGEGSDDNGDKDVERWLAEIDRYKGRLDTEENSDTRDEINYHIKTIQRMIDRATERRSYDPKSGPKFVSALLEELDNRFITRDFAPSDVQDMQYRMDSGGLTLIPYNRNWPEARLSNKTLTRMGTNRNAVMSWLKGQGASRASRDRKRPSYPLYD